MRIILFITILCFLTRANCQQHRQLVEDGYDGQLAEHEGEFKQKTFDVWKNLASRSTGYIFDKAFTTGTDFVKNEDEVEEDDVKSSRKKGRHKYVDDSDKMSSKATSTTAPPLVNSNITNMASVENDKNTTPNVSVIETTPKPDSFVTNVAINSTVVDPTERPGSLNDTGSDVTVPSDSNAFNVTMDSETASNSSSSLNLTTDNVTIPNSSVSSNVTLNNVTTPDVHVSMNVTTDNVTSSNSSVLFNFTTDNTTPSSYVSLNATMGNVTTNPPVHLNHTNTTTGIPWPLFTDAPITTESVNGTTNYPSTVESSLVSDQPSWNWTADGALGDAINENEGGNDWFTFHLFLSLLVMGLLLVAFLYWRSVKKRGEDEISLYSRTPQSEYANPTFEGDGNSSLSSQSMRNYRTLK
ncbi:uncharacterized protein LOC143038199 [Oratosquilla oratoria]|uniref:uncharacterized protein LOC143038199 n=1 Tax=Oratosquilla oratoria TaxID=337810 RepID=UPI003F77211C